MTSSLFSTFFKWNNSATKAIQIVICFLLLLTIAEGAAAATKMLMMNPVRAIFADRQRSLNVSIANTSKDTINYTVSLVTMRKGPDGKFFFVEDETEEEKLVKSMIRYSPRRATIEPGKRQVIRLMLRKPKELPVGEYQTRIRFTPLRDIQTNNQAGQGSSAEGVINVDLIVSSTFPIIIQHGVEAEISPQSISFKKFPKTPSGVAADVVFSRTGTSSAFGNVFLKYTPADNSKEAREIGRGLGLAIYLPATEKTMTIPLKDVTPQELTSGTIQVLFQPHLGIAQKRKKREPFRTREFSLQ